MKTYEEIENIETAIIIEAISAKTVDDACLIIQDAIEQNDGGIASLFFSFMDDEEKEWNEANKLIRMKWIVNYILCELSFIRL